MKIYVIKSEKNIKLFLYRLFTGSISGISSSMFPASLVFKALTTFPLESTNTLFPLFADLTTNCLASIDLKIAFEKC